MMWAASAQTTPWTSPRGSDNDTPAVDSSLCAAVDKTSSPRLVDFERAETNDSIASLALMGRVSTCDSIASNLADMAKAYSRVVSESALADSEVEARRAARRARKSQDPEPEPFADAITYEDFAAMLRCQGAWEHIPDGVDGHRPRILHSWLRSFVITGMVWFGGDGSDGNLVRRDDGSISMEGGVLTLEEDGTLCRKGKSGDIIRFRRLKLPSPEVVDMFRGVWVLLVGNIGTHNWLRHLTIKGRVWASDSPGHEGLLRGQEGNDDVMLSNYVLSESDQGTLLRLTSRSGDVLLYALVEEVPTPWHFT
jgi:hypothetical protein